MPDSIGSYTIAVALAACGMGELLGNSLTWGAIHILIAFAFYACSINKLAEGK